MQTQGSSAQEPNKGSKTDRMASPGRHNAKRLLPMELRKRRRAAKCQVITDKKARIMPNVTTSSLSPATPIRLKEAKEDTDDTCHKTISTVIISPTKAVYEPSFFQKSPRVKAPAATVSTRLHSLYKSSLLSQKAQKRLIVSGANVPNTFQVAELPLDIVPKTKLSILMAFPYPFQRTTSKVKQQALQSFMSGTQQQMQPLGLQSPAARWQQALHYFVHPAGPVPPSVHLNRPSFSNTSESLLRGHKRENHRDENTFFTTRWHTWQEAFRDVYMTFRHQTTNTSGDSNPSHASFYLHSSEFVVHFLYDIDNQRATTNYFSIIDLGRQYAAKMEISHTLAKEATVCRLRAVMSQSSAKMRKELHHLNVAYTMPYSKANQTQREVGEFHALAKEFEARQKLNEDQSCDSMIASVTSATAVVENLQGADSLLLFYGHDAVHGLYEFLINRTPMSNQDVPELYALYPFANASIQRLRVTSFGRVGAEASNLGSKDQAAQSATLFRLEILGFCFPSSVAKLLGVLRDEMEASYDIVESTTEEQKGQIVLRAYMEAMPGAARLNAIKLDEQIARGLNEKSSDQQKYQKRQQELELSKRRIEMAVVMKRESRYNVETTNIVRR